MRLTRVSDQNGFVGYRYPANTTAVNLNEFSNLYLTAIQHDATPREALDYANENVTYNAGLLPEVTATGHLPGVHRVPYRDVPGGNRVAYDWYLARQNERAAQKGANLAGGLLVAGASPVIVGAAAGAIPYTSVFPTGASIGKAAAIGGAAGAMASCLDGVCTYNAPDPNYPFENGGNHPTIWTHQDDQNEGDMYYSVIGGRNKYTTDTIPVWQTRKGYGMQMRWLNRGVVDDPNLNIPDSDLKDSYNNPTVTWKKLKVSDVNDAQRRYRK